MSRLSEVAAEAERAGIERGLRLALALVLECESGKRGGLANAHRAIRELLHNLEESESSAREGGKK